MLDEGFADTCVKLSIEAYNKLPKTGKPTKDEWTIVSTVIEQDSTKVRVVSLGSGSKCIGKNFLNPKGHVVNDSHAEVIARRGFLLYLYSEIMSLHKNGTSIFYKCTSGKLNLKNNVKFGFVTSAVPCGDAAIIPVEESVLSDEPSPVEKQELVEEACPPSKRARMVKPEIGDIHRTGAKCLPSENKQDLKLPGANYHTVRVVRTKPGRGDPTASVSCSDKLARWNVVGVQGALLSLLLEAPIQFQFIVVAGGGPFSHKSLERALNERVGVPNNMKILQSRLCFPVDRSDVKSRPAPSCIAWNCSTTKASVSVEGRRLGYTKKNINQSVLDISKSMILQRFLSLIETCGKLFPSYSLVDLRAMTYRQLKDSATNYQSCWKSLKEDYFGVWTEKPPGLENFTEDS